MPTKNACQVKLTDSRSCQVNKETKHAEQENKQEKIRSLHPSFMRKSSHQKWRGKRKGKEREKNTKQEKSKKSTVNTSCPPVGTHASSGSYQPT